jgi:hypothetical protein
VDLKGHLSHLLQIEGPVHLTESTLAKQTNHLVSFTQHWPLDSPN